MRISVPGNGGPTVSTLLRPTRFTQVPAEVSVSPQPSSTVKPSREKKRSTLLERGAPPETKSLIRPPNRSLRAAASLGKTSFSPIRNPSVRTSWPRSWPSDQASKPFKATPKSQPFTPGVARPFATTAL